MKNRKKHTTRECLQRTWKRVVNSLLISLTELTHSHYQISLTSHAKWFWISSLPSQAWVTTPGILRWDPPRTFVVMSVRLYPSLAAAYPALQRILVVTLHSSMFISVDPCAPLPAPLSVPNNMGSKIVPTWYCPTGCIVHLLKGYCWELSGLQDEKAFLRVTLPLHPHTHGAFSPRDGDLLPPWDPSVGGSGFVCAGSEFCIGLKHNHVDDDNDTIRLKCAITQRKFLTARPCTLWQISRLESWN